MNSLGFVGKLGFAIVVGYLGVVQIMNAKSLVGLVPNSLPYPIVFVYLGGLALVAAGVALLINKKSQLAMLLLGILLFAYALLVDLPRGNAGMTDLLRDIGLACAAWFICAHANE